MISRCFRRLYLWLLQIILNFVPTEVSKSDQREQSKKLAYAYFSKAKKDLWINPSAQALHPASVELIEQGLFREEQISIQE